MPGITQRYSNESVSYFVISQNWTHKGMQWGINFSKCIHDAVQKCQSGQKIVIVLGEKVVTKTDPLLCAFTMDFKPTWNKKIGAWQSPEVFSILEEISFEEIDR